jgi:hypothetical protein
MQAPKQRDVGKNGRMSTKGEAGETPVDSAHDGRRYQDDSVGIWTFTHEDILVVCPNCSAPAIVRIIEMDERHPVRSARELTCDHCLVRRRSGSVLLVRGGPRDPFLHEQLWLQTPCSGHVLWAFNEAHLEFLRAVVQAKLRENAPGSHITDNYSGRLPRWVLHRKNRGEVLKAIDRLRRAAGEHRVRT